MRLLKSRLYEPGLNCPNCTHLYRKSKGRKPPLCLTKKGCPIIDVAPDSRLNDKVNAFIQLEILSFAGGSGVYDEQGRKLSIDSGLAEESIATILKGKRILAAYREYQNSKGAKKAPKNVPCLEVPKGSQ